MSAQALMCFWRHTKLKPCFSSHFSRLIKPHNPPWTQGFLKTSLLSELCWKETKKRFPADIRQSDFKSKLGTQPWLSLSTFLNLFKPKNWESMLVLPTRKQLQTSDKPFCSSAVSSISASVKLKEGSAPLTLWWTVDCRNIPVSGLVFPHPQSPLLLIKRYWTIYSFWFCDLYLHYLLS